MNWGQRFSKFSVSTFGASVCFAFALLSTCVLADELPTEDLPNIVIILADDLGYGDVGCYNPESKIPTPHLDRLATQGMRFTDAHSPCTVCTPTRYSLMTGRMAFRTPSGGRVFSGAGGPSLIQPGRLTLPQMLRDKGCLLYTSPSPRDATLSRMPSSA